MGSIGNHSNAELVEGMEEEEEDGDDAISVNPEFVD